eukprot:gb/GECG01015844.1/.p1 GENE.gb/GECG01015844.1/~~gb/GECG01015844.1/.p1  ORF type:complete len:805 (+),score=79.24 gb/GECG01015844.1/:1-2415(+)
MGGIIGNIHGGSSSITVTYSVYNGQNGGSNRVAGPGSNQYDLGTYSSNVNCIRGELYHASGMQVWSDRVWAINGTDEFPVLRFQLPTPSPTASATASITPSPSSTKTPSNTPSNTKTATSSKTPSGTPTRTSTVTLTRTPSNSGTASRTPPATGTSSSTPTGSRSPTYTGTPSETRTSTHTPTSTETPTSTRTTTSTLTETPSATATVTRTETTTPSRTPAGTATCTPSKTPSNTATASRTSTSTSTSSETSTSTASSSPSKTGTSTLTPTHTPTETTTTTKTSTSTSTSSESRTSTPTHSRTTTTTPSQTSTSTSRETRTSTPTYSPTKTTASTQTSTSTNSATSSRSSTSTGSSSETVTRDSTVSSTTTRSPTLTQTLTPTSTSSPSMTAAETSTSSATPSPTKSITPSVSTTSSTTSTFRTLAGGDHNSSESRGSGGSTIASALRFSVPATLAGAIVVWIIYLGYRRRKNETVAKASHDPRAMYATQLGIPLDSLKLMSSLEPVSSAPTHVSLNQPDGGPLLSGTGEESIMRQYSRTSQMYGVNPLGEAKLAHINPLAAGPHMNRAEQTESKSRQQIVTDKFSLKPGTTDRRNIKSYELAGAEAGTQLAGFAFGSMVVRAGESRRHQPRVLLVDASAQSAGSADSVRIVSTKTPRLESGQKHGNRTLQVAVAADVDTTQLRHLDRTRLKLRHWKARLLAEPPPLIQVETGSPVASGVSGAVGESSCQRSVSEGYATSPLHGGGRVRRLEFASSRAGASSVGSGLSHETKEHHRSQLRLEDDPSKMFFTPQVPRSRRALSLY